ncbi:hypothetical protein DS2_04710 [Catenovulum agarivorans DS-2]|uniref:PEP-CTERM/exosortase system-associated acyltransferase n=1 Tax=Catenovulum agarivorans DS-2 TaxID=1328313 RepID=W7QE11_9ALTE|nr:PEP-CTERM/exosortase system-associated acyltransferase [Catenovulum agarivorans]EWH11129.1 hypothetical protein DS2_04710 [Catenovulum agarivorans DS-2]
MNLQKTLSSLSKKPIIGGIFKFILGYAANKTAKSIAHHFSQFLQPQLAITDELQQESYKVRYNVYCHELHFLEENDLKLEKDHFDEHSIHVVIKHKSTNAIAGTVRIVTSENEQQKLPLEAYCPDAVDSHEMHPANQERTSICEASRLAVPAEFRRRNVDKYDGAATGVINEQSYSEMELRCFPFIAIGLYLCAANITIAKGIDHIYVMMEPRLARSLRFVGIPFTQIGPVVEYHGKRAPFHIDPRVLLKTLSPGYKMLMKNIEKELKRQGLGREI